MKRRILPGLALLSFVLLMLDAAAQSKAPINEPNLQKPRLFAALPTELSMSVADMEQLLLPAKSAARSEDLMRSEKKIAVFTANYVSATSLYENKVHSVVLRLKDFPGATLTLSSSTNPDGTVAYAGRIISFQHADMYMLVKKGEGYWWEKKGFYDVVAE